MTDMDQNAPQILEEKLNSFHFAERVGALRRLKKLAADRKLSVATPKPIVNLHAHTFFSFNARGYSPSRFVWEAYKAGLEIAGTIDFDVIDAVDETLLAGDILGTKTTAGLESRVFIEELKDHEFNSPREPGVYYLVGHGFVRHPRSRSTEAATLNDMRRRAQERYSYMLAAINDYLGIVRLDYKEDILPLTPAANPTERHLLQAFEKAVRLHFKADKESLIRFWAKKLLQDESEETAYGRMARTIDDPQSLMELIRSELMKFGGVAYRQPDANTFPPLNRVVDMIRGCGALPSAAWLNGKSNGEADVKGHIEFLANHGIELVNIIPDRNWNVKEDKEYILRKLDECVRVAREMELPIVVGTEMNKYGQRFTDDFETPELAPYVGDFLRGARILYGHTLLARSLNFGYISEAALTCFGDDRAAKNAFFEKVGKATIAPAEALGRLSGEKPEPARILKALAA